MKEKRTRKTGYHKPRALAKQIRKCHDISCDEIERKEKPGMCLPRSKNKTRWSSGFCKICGEHMDLVTHYHANLHGYKRAEDLIRAGMITFD